MTDGDPGDRPSGRCDAMHPRKSPSAGAIVLALACTAHCGCRNETEQPAAAAPSPSATSASPLATTPATSVPSPVRSPATRPLGDASPQPAFMVAQGLSAFDPIDYWTRQLSSGDRDARQAAALALGLSGGATDDSVAALTTMLDDPDAELRRLAAQTLARIGPNASSARSRLEALAADDPDESVRAAATVAVASVGGGDAGSDDAATPAAATTPPTSASISPPPRITPPVLAGDGRTLTDVTRRLSDRDEGVRLHAIREASSYGTLGAPAVGEIVRNLRDSSAAIRRESAAALGIIGSSALAPAGSVPPNSIGRVLPPMAFGPSGQDAIDGLADLLEDDDATVRLAAARALARIGRPASDAADELERAASDDADEAVRQAAAQALASVGGTR